MSSRFDATRNESAPCIALPPWVRIGVPWGVTASPASEPIHPLTSELLASFKAHPLIEHLGEHHLPQRDRVIALVEQLRRLVFPGFFDRDCSDDAGLDRCVSRRLAATQALLQDQVARALRCHPEAPAAVDPAECLARAEGIATAFLSSLPEIRRLLALDVQAAFDGDPASQHTDEAVFCYPGVDALFTHRVAHRLHRLEVPLLPRIMSEVAHGETGIDIHPGATIGESCFIDHGTGIVIGETAVIGKHAKLYQGVTLGALSLRGGHQRWVGRKRHPTLGDAVTIYAGAVILGGQTHIGNRATIGGSVFLTRSVPAGHTVVNGEQKLVSTPPGGPAFDPVI